MRLSLPVSLSLLLLSWPTARAQLAPADDFFHGGAQFYISNNISSALEQVEAGLKIYPDDEKLKKLEELLKQKQQQQQQQDQKDQNQQNQSQQQKSDDQKKQQQQNQPPPSSQKDAQDPQKPDKQEKNQSGEKKDEPQKQPEQQKLSADKKDGEKPDQQNAAGQPVMPGQMTSEEAKHLLDAQKGDEQLLQMKPQGKPQDNLKPVKDW